MFFKKKVEAPDPEKIVEINKKIQKEAKITHSEYTEMADHILEQQCEEDDVDEKIEPVIGENSFETRILTWIKYFRSYYDEFLVKGTLYGMKNKKNIKKFLAWDNFDIDTKSIIFVKEFTDMLISISNIIFIDKYCHDISYEYNETTKSTTLIIENGNVLKRYKITFDFYKIPGKINSLLDNMDLETSSLLERYINDGAIDSDTEYVNISYQYYKDKVKEITVPLNERYNIHNHPDCVILESIIIRTYTYLYYIYKDILSDSILDYYGITNNDYLYQIGFDHLGD